MGTRGFVGFVVGGTVKIGYNHFDSYPEYLGVNVFNTVCRWLSGGEIEKRVQQAQDLRLVDSASRPAPEDRIRLGAYRQQGVGEAGSWYELLRETQGDLDAILDCGVMEDATDAWPRDSLFCEWGYLVDLDRRKLEVYEGFQKEPPAAGRWAKAEPLERAGSALATTYYPVNRIVEFDLGALPGNKEEFLRVIKAHARKGSDED